MNLPDPKIHIDKEWIPQQLSFVKSDQGLLILHPFLDFLYQVHLQNPQKQVLKVLRVHSLVVF